METIIRRRYRELVSGSTEIVVPDTITFDGGINFRANAGFVTDGTNETYCLSESYPTVRAGLTFGWTAGSPDGRDRSNTVDRRLAGMNFLSGEQGTFRLDVTPGTYSIYLGLCDNDNDQHTAIELLDDADSRGDLIPDTNVLAGTVLDASATINTVATWPVAELPQTNIVISTGILTVKVGVIAGGNNYVIAHLRALQTA